MLQLTHEKPHGISTDGSDSIPRIPRAEEVDHFLGVCLGLLCCRVEDGGERFRLFLEIRLPVHGHMNDDVQPICHQRLLDCAGILGNATAALILSRARDDNGSNAAEVGICGFEVQDLARDARDVRVRRAQIDPRASISNQGADVVARGQRGVLVRQGWDNRPWKGRVRLLSGCETPLLGPLVSLFEMVSVQVNNPLEEVLVCDGCSDKAELNLVSGVSLCCILLGLGLTPLSRTEWYWSSVSGSDRSESC